jgi:hypothetical protein
MSAFADKVLLDLHEPAKLAALLTDAGFDTVKALFASVYDLPAATLAGVKALQVLGVEFQRPIFTGERRTGTLTKTIPAHERTDLHLETLGGAPPHWVDIVAALRVTVVLDADPGEVESVRTTDLDASSILAEIRLKPLGPFDPDDPANERAFDLRVAFLIRDGVDVAGALRDAKLTRALLERGGAFHPQLQEAEVRTPFAPAVIFPADALPAGVTAGRLQAFFADERVQVLLAQP